MSEEKSNVEFIDNRYSKEQLFEIERKQKKKLYRRRRLTLLSMIAIAIFFILGYNYHTGVEQLKKMEAEKTKIVKEEQEVASSESDLKATVTLLQDSEYVQKLARYKYWMTKSKEQLFILPENDTFLTDSSTSGSTSSSEDTSDSNK